MNLIPRSVGGFFNDGYLIRLFSSGDKSALGVETFHNLQQQLIAGTRPRDLKTLPIQEGQDYFALIINLIMYYKGLDSDNQSLMDSRMEKIIAGYDFLEDIQRISLDYELMTCHLIKGQDLEADRIYERIKIKLNQDQDVNGHRVRAYYLYYGMLDKINGIIEAKKGLEVWVLYPIKGLGLMEKDLLLKITKNK